MGSRETTFRSVLAYAIGGGWGAENVVEGSVPVAVIRGTDFASLNAGVYSQVPRRFEKKSKVERRALKKGDIILEISGGSPSRGQTTGRSYYVDERTLAGIGGRVIPASFCRLVRVDESKVVPKFAYYWLQDMYLSKRAAEYENQSTGISNFQFESFLDREATELPPLDYQSRVVALLGALEERIFTLRQVSDRLEAIARALFKSWFVDFDPVRAKAEGREPEGMDVATSALFPADFSDSPMGLIPLGWRPVRFGDVAFLSKGTVKPQTMPSTEFQHYSLPAFDAHKLPLTELGEAIKSNKTPVPSGAVLVSKLNPHIPRIWYVGDVAENSICSTEFLVWAPKAGAGSAFVYCLAASQVFNSAMRQLVTGTSNSHQRVKPDQLADVEVIAASDAALSAFEAIAAPLLAKVHHNRTRAATLIQVRDALLPRLISGKLRLPDAERKIEAATA